MDQRAIEAENAECDALLERLQQRREIIEKQSANRLVYKVRQNVETTMDDAASASWNSWFARSFDDRIGAVLEVIGSEVRKQGDDILGRLDQIAAQLAELEARVSDLEGSGSNNKSAPLLMLNGGRDAA
jgi:hypothetical protein